MNTRSLSLSLVATTLTLGFVLVLIPRVARAATFSIIPDRQSFALGDTFTADVRIDTENVGVNAAQGTISFSPSVLAVTKVDRTNSVFNFWLQDPSYSNDAGTVSFLGGSTNGFSGAALETFRVTFQVKGVGTSTITFTDGAITASDGSGTNVMRGTRGISITTAAQGSTTTIAPPTQITRPPTPSARTPAMPAVIVPLHPDPAQWSNVSAPFNAKWVLPSDVTDVATLVNKDPRGVPGRSEGLFDNKDFPALSDGIWYLHVRFMNSNGWGPTAHYALRVDTTPPPAFTVRVNSGTDNDNPTPQISYASADPLSGISFYAIFSDNTLIATTTADSFSFPPQKPGKHTFRIAAHDNAENVTEGTVETTIKPIASPIATLTGAQIFSGEGSLGLSGTSLPGTSVQLSLKDARGNLIASTVARVDAVGDWSKVFTEPLKTGGYSVEAVAVDGRGAQSLPAIISSIAVQERPLLTLGGIGITKTGLIWILALFLFGGIGGGIYLGRISKEGRTRRVLIAKRDVTNTLGLIRADLLKVLDAFADKKLTEEEMARVTYALQHILDTINKTERYIVENISEIKE